MSSSALDVAATKALSARGWVSLRQFAVLSGVSYPTACAMRDRKDIKVVPVGGIYRIYADELKRFLEEGNLPKTD